MTLSGRAMLAIYLVYWIFDKYLEEIHSYERAKNNRKLN